ncbi:hypothetical protein EBR96_06085, partial [bacterium]|nr:hypothetical protein [bacterium]
MALRGILGIVAPTTQSIVRTVARVPRVGAVANGIGSRASSTEALPAVSSTGPVRTEVSVPLSLTHANRLIENVVGVGEIGLHKVNFSVVPISGYDSELAHFKLGSKLDLAPVPLAEPIMVPLASPRGLEIGRLAIPVNRVFATPSEMTGHILLVGDGAEDVVDLQTRLESNTDAFTEEGRKVVPRMYREGVKLPRFRVYNIASNMAVLEVTGDVGEAMGANMINKLLEAIRLYCRKAQVFRQDPLMAILSNSSHRRLGLASSVLSNADLNQIGISGPLLKIQIENMRGEGAVEFNRRILSCVVGGVIATGNDWRAVLAGCHKWAMRTGHYLPLLEVDEISQAGFDKRDQSKSMWALRLSLPLALGTVGRVSDLVVPAGVLKSMGSPTSQMLAGIFAGVALKYSLNHIYRLPEGSKRFFTVPFTMPNREPVESLRTLSPAVRREKVLAAAGIPIERGTAWDPVGSDNGLPLPVGIIPNAVIVDLMSQSEFTTHISYSVEEPSIGASATRILKLGK